MIDTYGGISNLVGQARGIYQAGTTVKCQENQKYRNPSLPAISSPGGAKYANASAREGSRLDCQQFEFNAGADTTSNERCASGWELIGSEIVMPTTPTTPITGQLLSAQYRFISILLKSTQGKGWILEAGTSARGKWVRGRTLTARPPS